MSEANSRDSQAVILPIPPPATGEVGPNPTENVIPDGDPTRFGGGQGPDETGEEEDPGIANAGGVNASNTDGSIHE